jgi:glycosyltransferase involved in cell wall biosynthesis
MMKIALVHDYLNEYGGAERVLEALAELYPNAPIYTAFYKKGSPAHEQFKHRDIRVSWAHYIPGFISKLHSPLRFLTPQIWESFDFSAFDVVISSSSWYITKGVRVPSTSLHVSYIHTPPRFLYGYETSMNWRKHWWIRMYAAVVNKELRQYDYATAQRVDVLVANSQEVRGRIAKFWRRDSEVIYPPVAIYNNQAANLHRKGDYLLTGGRLVGPKHFDIAIQAANALSISLKVFGVGPEEERLRVLAGPTVEFLGKVGETELVDLYTHAQAFITLADDEDFGITPVEAMMCGTPVVAYWGGGYKESVVEGKTGTFVHELTCQAVENGIASGKVF